MSREGYKFGGGGVLMLRVKVQGVHAPSRGRGVPVDEVALPVLPHCLGRSLPERPHTPTHWSRWRGSIHPPVAVKVDDGGGKAVCPQPAAELNDPPPGGGMPPAISRARAWISSRVALWFSLSCSRRHTTSRNAAEAGGRAGGRPRWFLNPRGLCFQSPEF